MWGAQCKPVAPSHALLALFAPGRDPVGGPNTSLCGINPGVVGNMRENVLLGAGWAALAGHHHIKGDSGAPSAPR